MIIDLYRKTFPNFSLVTYIKEIEYNLKNCKTILDVGCGDNSPLRLLSKKYQMVGVDGYKKALTDSKKKGIHDHYLQLDVKKLPTKFKSKSFDAVLALDVIEHLTKKGGEIFLSNLEKIAKKVVIIVTPNGFVDQHNKVNQLQEHLSGWEVKDFKKHKYNVIGLYGLKMLRGEGAKLKLKPKIIWGVISELSHYLFTRNNPQKAFSLIAIKKIH